MTFSIGNWLAALVTGLVLLGLLIKWGHKLPDKVKLDDIARIFVAVFCVIGPLYATPRFHQFALWVQGFFTSGAEASTSKGSVGVAIVGVLLVAAAAGWYLASPSWGRLAVLGVATLPLFTNNTMQSIAQWWVNHLGSSGFRFLISALDWVAGYGWHF
jgi:hypothetical protein